jgi:hypothetical protein
MSPSRAEIIRDLHSLLVLIEPHDGCSLEQFSKQCDAISSAAAELDKRCGNCKHYEVTDRRNYGIAVGHYCVVGHCIALVPDDGSGYCFRHEPKAEDR